MRTKEINANSPSTNLTDQNIDFSFLKVKLDASSHVATSFARVGLDYPVWIVLPYLVA